MNTDIKVSGSLVFPEGAPARAGEVVNNIEEVRDIPAPRVGMIVYDKGTELNYIIRSLKEKVIDGVRVDNAQVDEYELYDVAAEELRAKREEQKNAAAIAFETERAQRAEKKNADAIAANAEAIGKSLNNVEFSLTESELGVLQMPNNGDFNEVLIPSATHEEAGVMSCDDKQCLDALDMDDSLTLTINDTEEAYQIAYDYRKLIPKGVKVFLESDTITSIKGAKTKAGDYITLTNGVVTDRPIKWLRYANATGDLTIRYSGKLNVLSDRIDEETQRATAAEKKNADAITAETERAQRAEQANADAIAILKGTGEGSVYKVVTDELAKLVGDSPESLDTIHEIAEWINNEEDGAAAVVKKTNENATAIAEETQRATAAEVELLNRLQGASELSDAAKDPFKFLGEFLTPNSEELHAALNNLHSTDKANGYEGVWRFTVQGKPSVLYNFAMNYPQDKWLQGLITIYSPTGNSSVPFTINNKVNILYRSLEGGSWSSWRLITQDNADAIAEETQRATAAEETLRKTIGNGMECPTKKRNYIHCVDGEAFVVAKYDNKRDIIIHFAKTLANELYTVKSVYLAENTDVELSTDITREPIYKLCQQVSSDMIGPISVKTGSGLSWVGGNHLYLNQSSGVKTAKTVAVNINADHTAIGSGRLYADKVTIRVKNEIYDPNIAPAAGDDILQSRLLDEFVTYTIDSGEILVSVEHKYRKDTYVGVYYGMQSMFINYNSLIANEGIVSWETKRDLEITKAYAPELNRFSQKNADGYYQNTVLLPYGLGKHNYVGDESNVLKAEGSKVYHVLMRSANVKTGDIFSWMGVYNWNKPIIDNDSNYIYSFRDKENEHISVSALSSYTNLVVPVSQSLSNKVYTAKGDVRVDEIVGYNIVLTADSAGSSVLSTVNEAEKANADAIAANAEAIGKSLNSVEFSLTESELGVLQMPNNGDFNEVLIPSATHEEAGVMSCDDKQCLDALDMDDSLTLTINDTEEAYQIAYGYRKLIPKGVKVFLESDTITSIKGAKTKAGDYITLTNGVVTDRPIKWLRYANATGDLTIRYSGKLNVLSDRIDEETQRALSMEQQLQDWMDADKQEIQAANNEIKASAMQYNTLGVSVYADKAEIYGRSIEGTPRVHEFPAATTEKAGVMSAADKVTLENIPNAIEEGEKRVLRRLFIAAGAEYNDTDAVQIRKVKFDTSETVEHLPHCYCLNGLGDISEEEMLKIYNLGHFYGGVYGALSGIASRTNLGRSGPPNFSVDSPSLAYASKCTTISLCIPTVSYESTIYVKSNNYFSDATNLRAIYGKLVMENSYSNTFNNCVSLERVRIRTSVSVTLGSSPLINKKSLLYAIENATPAAAITITLHPDAYTRLADDAEVVAALEAQPLITLVSA